MDKRASARESDIRFALTVITLESSLLSREKCIKGQVCS